jgi:hypothetical protein
MTPGILTFGSQPTQQDYQNSVINFHPTSFWCMNLAAQSPGLIQDITTASSNYYPTATPSAATGFSAYLPSNYYGHYTLSWTGKGSYTFTGLAYLIYSGGTYCGFGTTYGSGATNGPNLFGQTNPSVEFAYGAILSSFTNSSGLVKVVCALSNSFYQLPTTFNCQINNFTGIPNGSQCTGTVIDFNNVVLSTVSYSSSFALVGGNPGTATECIFQNYTTQNYFPTTANGYGSSATQMNNLILCRKTDNDGTNPYGIQNGYYVAQEYVNAYRALNPKFIRFMDFSSVNPGGQSRWATRLTPSQLGWQNGGLGFCLQNYVGAITWNASDAYTCAASPLTSSSTGPYVDGETFDGIISVTNSSMNPTLNVNGRGPAPIYGGTDFRPYQFRGVMSGTVPTAGSTLSITFTSTWVSGGSATVTYNVTSADVSGGVGTLANNFANAMASSGSAFIAQPICLGAINPTSPTLTFWYNNNIGGVWTSALPSGLNLTIGPMLTSILPSSASPAQCSFIYMATLNGFCAAAPGVAGTGGLPVEIMADLCNRTGCGMHWCISYFMSPVEVGNAVTTIAGVLNQKLLLEYGNEMWNYGNDQTIQACCYAASIGTAGSYVVACNTTVGLKIRQYAPNAIAAWTAAGQLRSNLYIGIISWIADAASDCQLYRFEGAGLASSTNGTYQNVGGINGSSGINYNVYPNRPIDYADSIGYATYWYGLISGNNGTTTTIFTGSITTFNALLTASANYAAGGSINVNSALAAWDLDARSNPQTDFRSTYAAYESILENYDSGSPNRGRTRVEVTCYEGGLQESLSNSFNGTQTSALDNTPGGASNTLSYFSKLAPQAVVTATSSGTNLIVSAVTGIMVPDPYRTQGNYTINGVSTTYVPSGTYITAQLSGTQGGVGTYQTNVATTVSSSLTASFTTGNGNSYFTGTSTGGLTMQTCAITGTIRVGDWIVSTGLTPGTSNIYVVTVGTSTITTTQPTNITAASVYSGWDLTQYSTSYQQSAINMAALFVGYINSNYYYNSMKYWYEQLTTASSGRPAYPAQFGSFGPSVWCIWPSDITSTPYQDYNAIRDWNDDNLNKE